MQKVFISCGSMRKNSTNHQYIEAVKSMLDTDIQPVEPDSLMNIPYHNLDNNKKNVADVVTDFGKNIEEANGITTSTPEYAMGIPGVLKKAMDWIVSSSFFSKKPVLLITASSVGKKARSALIDVLNLIESNVSATNVLISFATAKINQGSKITDNIIEGTFRKNVNVVE